MRRREPKARGTRKHQARPLVEGLEGRQLLSTAGPRASAAQAAASPGGDLSAKGQVFRYVTINGGIATIRIVGVGTLEGTSVGPQGALNLVYGGTNVYSKIVGSVRGGGGHATLASIHNLQLIQSGQPDSLTGVGGTPLAAVLMNPFDLVPGGTINLTPGVTNVVLNSIGPNTNVQLRNLPPHPSYRILPTNAGNTAGGQVAGLYGQLVASSTNTSIAGNATLVPGTTNTSSSTSTTNNGSLSTGGISTGNIAPTETIIGTTIVPIVTGNSSLSAGSLGASSTLEAGQSATITTTQGTTLSYINDGGRQQVLTNVGGTFTAQPNLLEPLAPGQPDTEPPAPPGIILKAKTIGGTAHTVNPLTSTKIFGYDPTTGDLLRFNLNLQHNAGTVDSSFAPIAVPGDPQQAGVGITRVDGQRVVLVTSGSTVYAYNANTGTPVGSFATALPVDAIGTAGNITALGSSSANQIHMIDVAASLHTGTVQGLKSVAPFIPQSEVYLLGGLTGVDGSNNLYTTVGAHFTTVQPDQYQLGIQSIGTVAVSPGSPLSPQFSAISRSGLLSNGNFTTIQVNPVPAGQVGDTLGAVGQNLALDTGVSGGQNVLRLYAPSTLSSRGTIRLAYGNPLAGLSQSFFTGLGSSALIDIQGDVQSIRGNTARGMFVNDMGNLATIKIQHVYNSTVVGMPISHIVTVSRKGNFFVSTSRLAGGRNGVTQVDSLQPIGPISG